EVARKLRESDAFVMASYTEVFSKVMVEAMASGLPIVSTAVSGADGIIVDGRSGFVGHGRSAEEFAERVVEAVRIPDCKEFARQRCVRHYSAKRLWEVLGNAIDGADIS